MYTSCTHTRGTHSPSVKSTCEQRRIGLAPDGGRVRQAAQDGRRTSLGVGRVAMRSLAALSSRPRGA